MSVKSNLYDHYVSSGQAGGLVSANAAEQFASNTPYIRQVIRRHMPSDRSVRIVDLGCGHGGWIYVLKSHGYLNVAGVDISAEQVAQAHKLGITEVQEGELVPFLERQPQVDVVLLMDVLEHLTEVETNILMEKLCEKLSPTGKLIIHVPNGEGLFGQRIRYGDLTHETCFTPKSMNQLLTLHGFKHVACLEDRPIAHGLKSILRRCIWDIGTLYPRLLLAAETGQLRFVLSQNMTVVAAR